MQKVMTLQGCFAIVLSVLSLPTVAATPDSIGCKILRAAIANARSPEEKATRQREFASKCQPASAAPPVKQSPRAVPRKAPATGPKSTPSKRKPKRNSVHQNQLGNQGTQSSNAPTRPQSVTVTPAEDWNRTAISDAINRVTDGGTVLVRPGRYAAPGEVYKRVTVSGLTYANEARPVLQGFIGVSGYGVSLNDFDLELGQITTAFPLLRVSGSASISRVNVSGTSCSSDKSKLTGLLQVSGTADLYNVNVIAGNCYAVAISEGTITSSYSTWINSAPYVVVQSGGSLTTKQSAVSGLAAVNLFNNARATFIDTSITHWRDRHWWLSQDQTGKVFSSNVKVIAR